MTNLAFLGLRSNTITDISALSGLTRLKSLHLERNLLNDSSLNDHIPVLESYGVTVRFDSFRKGDFDIELVFLDDFTERHKHHLQWAARRWMSVIAGDLPDYEVAQGWSGRCGDHSIEIPRGERLDDLRIYVSGFRRSEKPGVAGFGGPGLLRDTGLPIVGCMAFNLDIYNWQIVGLHEMGHILGFGTIWERLGFLQDYSRDNPNLDTHFNGPLAVAAFDGAGGRDYAGAKVPVQKGDGAHWRIPVLEREIMGPHGGSALSAITVQSLADLGYGVDVTQADAYTLPGVAVTEARAKDAPAEARAKRAAVIPEDHRLREGLPSPAHAQPTLWCGLDGEREPIDVLDRQGRITLTIGN